MKLGIINHKDFLKEKTLWQIFRASQSIKDSLFNWGIGILSGAILGGILFLGPSHHQIGKMILKAADVGLAAGVSLLGFLIAGFTVFASLAKPKLVLAMAAKTHPGSDLSYLKYNYFTLMRVFIYFLCFVPIQLVLIVSGEGDLHKLVSPSLISTTAWHCILSSVFIIEGMFWVFMLLQLKSFVYNVYHFVMTIVRFEAIEHNETLEG